MTTRNAVFGFILALCVSFGFVSANAGDSHIVADPTAPGRNQPQVIGTGSGLPQVNISTPNANGLSYNRYQQFDVGRQGAILNNSTQNVQTQLGGWIERNPNLAGGSASLIVNEVNSSRPSQINGFIEIAGRRADVVLANPSGISVDGGGFINANRATLTTGTPVIQNGNLTGYEVRGGQIDIVGAGLNNRNATYTDIIAHSVNVNAKLHASQQLNIVAGENFVSRDSSQVTRLNPDAETGLSIDVKDLGGMYANQIRLVGTGRGVGVNSGIRNDGEIVAGVGEVVIGADGMLSNFRTISGQGGVNVATGEDVVNTGHIQSGGVVSLSSEQSIDNQSEILGDGGMDIAAGVNVDNSGLLQSRGDTSLTTATGVLDNSGDIVTLGDTSIATKGSVVNTGSIENGGDLSIATRADFENSGILQSGGDISIVSEAAVVNDSNIIAGENVEIRGDSISNIHAGTILGNHVSLGANSILNGLPMGEDGTGTSGLIGARMGMYLGAGSITNREDGMIYSGGELQIGGAIDSDGRATGRAGSFLNSSATIDVAGDITAAVDMFTNYNAHYATEMREVTPESAPYSALSTNSYNMYVLGSPGTWFSGGDSEFASINGDLIKDFFIHNVSTREYDTFVISTRPGFIYGGGDFTLDGNLTNDRSVLDLAGDLSVTGGSFTNIGAYEEYRVDITNAFRWTRWEWHGHLKDPEREYSGMQYRYTTEKTLRLKDILPEGYARKTEDMKETLASEGANPDSLDLNLNSNLYTVNSTPDAQYVVESNPRLTDYRSWMSSDYMLAMLSSDPQYALKRLGDGFYEQRMIREQLMEQAGRRFLDGFTDEEAQYEALMTAGVEFAKEFKLAIGVTLSAELMAQLTTDIVWMETVTVDTPNGPVQALAPKVYLAPGKGTLLDANGGLVAAKSVNLNLSDGFTNSGGVYATESLILTAGDIGNSGSLAGKNISLAALRDLNNAGGSITGDESVSLAAGNDLNITSTTQETSYDYGYSSGSNNNLDQIGVVSLTSGEGTMSLSAGRDINLKTGVIDSAGSATLTAGRDIAIGGTALTYDLRTSADSRNNTHVAGSEDVGSSIYTVGDLAMSAGRDLSVVGSEIYSESALSLSSGNDVSIAEGRSRNSVDYNIYTESKGFFSSRSEKIHGFESNDLAVGSDVSGNTVSIEAGNDFALRGSAVSASEGLSVTTGGDISIAGADNYSDDSYSREEKKKGFSVSFSGASVGISYGTTKKSDQNADREHSITGSLIGSETGDVNLYAGKDVGIAGSQVVAGTGDVTISGENVTIANQYESYDHSERHTFEQKGISLSVGLGGSVGTAVEAGLQAVDTLGKAQNASTGRAQALYGIAAARQGYDAGKAVGKIVNPTSDTPKFGLSVNLGFSSTKSESSSQSSDQIAVGSQISSGGDTTIIARGRENEANTGDLSIVGSQVVADGRVVLDAANDLALLSAEENSSFSSSNKNSSSGFGVGINLGLSGGGGGAGAGLSLSANAHASSGKGSGQGGGTTHVETIISGREGVEFSSGNDTTLKGAQIIGEEVLGSVGGDLSLISEQDTYNESQRQSSSGIGGSIGFTVGAGLGSVGGNYNSQKQKGDSDYASVDEQTGIFAGDDGFDITVDGHTDLTGAVIASTADSEKNSLVTGSISTEDIYNHSEYEATTKGGGAEFTYVKNPGNDDKHANTGSISPSLPMEDKGNDSSVTKSAIEEGSIIITDEAAQLAETGKTAEEAVELLNRDTENAHEGALARNPDLQELLDKQAELADAAAAAGRAVAQTVGDISQSMYEKTGDKGWKEGGIYKTILQGAGAALIAQLGNGEGLNAALGAMASQLAAGKLGDFAKAVVDQMGIDDPTVKELVADVIQGAISSGIGMAAGGETGANAASTMDRYNRQLHKEEKAKIKDIAKEYYQALLDGGLLPEGMTEEDIYTRLELAASVMVQAWAEYEVGSPEYQKWKYVEAVANLKLTSEMELLKQYQTMYRPDYREAEGGARGYMMFTYTGADARGDARTRWWNEWRIGTRFWGGVEAVGGASGVVVGTSAAVGTGGVAAVPGIGLAVYSADHMVAGTAAAIWGVQVDTLMVQGLRGLGLSEAQVRVIDAAVGLGLSAGTIKAVAYEAAKKAQNAAQAVSQVPVLTADVEQKILYGQRVSPNGQKMIGSHSGEISDELANWAVEIRGINPDGTRDAFVLTQYADDLKLSNVKSSTLFPESWDDAKTLSAIREVAETTPSPARASDGAVWRAATVDGVRIEVISINDVITAAYPSGSRPLTAAAFLGQGAP